MFVFILTHDELLNAFENSNQPPSGHLSVLCDGHAHAKIILTTLPSCVKRCYQEPNQMLAADKASQIKTPPVTERST